MKLKMLKCDWGMEYLGDMKTRLHTYAEAGYNGLECANIGMDPDEFADVTGELGLDYVAMMFCDDEQAFRDRESMCGMFVHYRAVASERDRRVLDDLRFVDLLRRIEE